MKKIETGFNGLYLLEPMVFNDNRGYFFESFNQMKFEELGLNYNFVQDNQSFSTFGTLRGLHLQKGIDSQAKLVRVVQGAVLDVVVDVRPESITFGKYYKCLLSEENKRMLIIPRGLAHGFIVLSERAMFTYKCDNYYNANAEVGLRYNDPVLGIDWEVEEANIKISAKDLKNSLFTEIAWSEM